MTATYVELHGFRELYVLNFFFGGGGWGGPKRPFNESKNLYFDNE